MAHRSKEAASQQVQSEVQKARESNGLPFRDLLSEDRILEALARSGVEFRDRIYTPMVTLWAFLSQVMDAKEASCQKAVSRVLADRVEQKKSACSPDTSSYCEARARMPEKIISGLARETGQKLDQQIDDEILWQGRHVKIVDGSTFTMADTEENQKVYPQSSSQKAGLGFPMARIIVFLSLAVGTVLECAIGAARGKKTGEQSLFRATWDVLKSGDIVLGDRLFDAYCDIAELNDRSVDSVFGMKQSRKVDFRQGQQLGPHDHVITWHKPKYDANRFSSKAEWDALPDTLSMREIRIKVRRKGYRTRTVMIVTTLLDATIYSAKDLTDLFAMRWHCELDLRSIKRSLGMHHLRCKTPEMVRKEMWTHLLAYNLIRVRMAQAAVVHGIMPRNLSFSAAKSLIQEFAKPLKKARGAEVARIEAELLKAISKCKVGNRPGRKEPRAVKKRATKYPYLTKPRDQARKGLGA
jgi:hypothetical protein